MKSKESELSIIFCNLFPGNLEAIQVEDIIIRTQNFYRKAFTYIHSSFSDIVYVKSAEWSRQYLEKAASKTKCQILIKLYNGVQDITYKQLSSQLFKELAKQIQSQENYQQISSARFNQLDNKLKEKNQIIKKLSQQIHFYEHHPSKEQYGYITQLEHKVAGLEKDLRNSAMHIRELENSQEYLSQYTNMLNQKVEELRAKLYQFEIQQFSNMKEVQSNSDLKEFQQNVEVLKDLIHKGALRMATMREQYNKIEAYNQTLLGQRSVLAKRAAVGFAELTPRPNYTQIFKKNDINIHELIPQHIKPTTQQLVSSLIKCFKQFYHKYVQKQAKLQIEKAYDDNQAGKDPGKLIMAQIDKVRRQLKKTERLSDDVHKGYTKSKEEKDQLKNKKK